MHSIYSLLERSWSTSYSSWLNFLWSPAIALAIAKTIIFCGCFYFFISGNRFFDILQPTFSKLCHMAWLWFQQNLCYRASPKVPPKTKEEQKPQILPIFGPDRNKFSTAVPQRERNRKSKIIVSITNYCRTRWHKFGGGRPTNNGDRRASIYAGWEDFATFGKYGVISWKRHKIGIQLLWRTYRNSQAIYWTAVSEN